MREVLSGFVSASALVAALYFFKWWRTSRDRLFLLFGAAFAVMAVNHFVLGLTNPATEARVVVYVARLISFLLILYAIWDKNRSTAR